jgi:protein SFI1
VVRAKRPELPASPEKRIERVLSPRLGAMSAPPAQRNIAGEVGGVTSFQRRLRDGGFSRSVAPARGRGKARVGFGDVSEMR